MENYQRKKMDVAVYAQRGNPNMRVMRGKALLDDEANDLKFVENAPAGPRSVEIGRTVHARFVRRPDGLYTVTIRVDGSSRYLREELTAEIAEITKQIAADKRQQSKFKKPVADDSKKEDDGSGDVPEEQEDEKGASRSTRRNARPKDGGDSSGEKKGSRVGDKRK